MTPILSVSNILSGNLKPRNKKYSHLRKLIIQDLPKDYNLESPEISVKPGKGQKKSTNRFFAMIIIIIQL